MDKASPPQFGDALLALAHLVQIQLSFAHFTCFSHTPSPHVPHWATGEDARAALPRFGPPHRGHSPAARLTDPLCGGLEAADENVLTAPVGQVSFPAHLRQRLRMQPPQVHLRVT